MIAHLKGIVLAREANKVLVDVHGVGYEIFVSVNTFYELPPEGMEVSLHIHSHIREDQFTLIGFLSRDEKSAFQQLLKVSGIGPKLALTLLSGLNPHELARAIAEGNAAPLKAITGIGQKVAERILLDLKGKFAPLSGHGKEKRGGQPYDEALSALTHLGYTQGEAQRALGRIDWSRDLPLKDAIKEGLKNLSKG